MRVVIADNNVQDRESKQTTMTNLGINVILATGNGSKALETIREEQPDVVIMDLILPGIDGIGILEEVNKGESPRRKPVFIIETALRMENLVDGSDSGRCRLLYDETGIQYDADQKSISAYGKKNADKPNCNRHREKYGFFL